MIRISVLEWTRWTKWTGWTKDVHLAHSALSAQVLSLYKGFFFRLFFRLSYFIISSSQSFEAHKAAFRRSTKFNKMTNFRKEFEFIFNLLQSLFQAIFGPINNF